MKCLLKIFISTITKNRHEFAVAPFERYFESNQTEKHLYVHNTIYFFLQLYNHLYTQFMDACPYIIMLNCNRIAIDMYTPIHMYILHYMYIICKYTYNMYICIHSLHRAHSYIKTYSIIGIT